MAYTSVSREVAEAARDAILTIPGVAGMHGGHFGEVALLLPGGRIEGLKPATRSSEPNLRGLEVNFIYDVSSERDIRSVADDVRTAALRATDVDFVDVVVADAA